jgi:hypothetical protein
MSTILISEHTMKRQFERVRLSGRNLTLNGPDHFHPHFSHIFIYNHTVMSRSMLMLMLKVITGYGPQTDLVGFGVDTQNFLNLLEEKDCAAVLLCC